MKQIRVLSRDKFNTIFNDCEWEDEYNFNIFNSNTCVIEILDTVPGGFNHKPCFNYNNHRVLIQRFDDYGEPQSNNTHFQDIQAQELMYFIEDHKDYDKFVIHCAAGISRSGAVGMFIYDYFKSLGEIVSFPEYSMVRPNPLVARTMNNLINKY